MKRVLIAEDDEDTRELLQIGLSDRYDVEAAADGQTALEMLRRKKFDILVTDWNMPGLDGVELAAELQKRRIRIPVIMTSAAWNKHRFRIPGISAFLAKPFEISALLLLLARLCEKAVARP